MDTATMELAWIAGESTQNAYATSKTMGAVTGSTATSDEERRRIYVFGGYGNGFSSAGYLQDVWVFDTEIDEFVEHYGAGEADQVADFDSNPQQIGSSVFHCSSDVLIGDQLYVFGGVEFLTSSGHEDYHNQLWTWNVTSKTWAHISGSREREGQAVYGTKGVSAPDNVPPSLHYHACWHYGQNEFYLGFGLNPNPSQFHGHMNSVWRYEAATSSASA